MVEGVIEDSCQAHDERFLRRLAQDVVFDGAKELDALRDVAARILRGERLYGILDCLLWHDDHLACVCEREDVGIDAGEFSKRELEEELWRGRPCFFKAGKAHEGLAQQQDGPESL